MIGSPAAAQVEGTCALDFNGVAVDRIDSLDSPLELETTDVLVFGGTSESGTSFARVELIIGPVTVESGSVTYATPAQEFQATIDLDDVTPYGVGLFRAIGRADGCVGSVWVRVSGRMPLATLTGLTALGLTLGGITGQLGATVARSRWSRSAAALGGIATGTGLAVLAQQFGRLQISYPSVAAASAVAAILGFAGAWLLNPGLREARAERRRSRPVPAPVAASPRPPRRTTRQEEPEVSRIEVDEAPTASSGKALPTADTTPAAPPDSPYWCYVMAPTDVFDLTDHTKRAATLVPGTWYLAKRTVGGWVHVVVSDGTEGWVAQHAVHRQG